MPATTAPEPQTTPDRLTIEATGTVELVAAADGSGKRPTFDITGYTGAPMNLAGFYVPVVVDLVGLKAAGDQIPALRNHDPDRIVGQADRVTIDPKGVRLAGTVTGDNADATEVVTQAGNGFKWKASIGATVVRREFIEAGKTVTVNGRAVTGPAIVAREARLDEISFVAIAADGDTSVSVAARKGSTMPTETEHETAPAADPIKGERERIQAIRAVCGGRHAEIEDEAIASGLSVDQVKARLFDDDNRGADLDALRASRAPVWGRSGAGTQAAPGDTIEAGLLIRCGREDLAVKHYGEQTATRARAARFNSLVDVCAAALRIDGRDPGGMSRPEMIKAALSTYSLPNMFANVMGKSLFDAYAEGTATWRGFARILPAADFKPQTAMRPSFVGELEKLPRGGEVKHASMAESVFNWQIDQYAKMFSVDRMDVINDDLGFLGSVPTMMGTTSARAVSDLVWRTILENASTFFTSGRHNLITAALGETGLQAGISAMRTLRDDNGNDINIIPRVLAVPPELEFTALALVNSSLVGRTDGGPTGNSLLNLVEVVAESRISNTTKFTGASTTEWFLFGGPLAAPVIVGFLDGREAPIIETFGFDSDPNRLALSYRVYLDFGSALGDYRAALKSTGAG